MFKLIREHLPHVEESSGESSTFGDRLLVLLMIIAGLGAVVYGILFGLFSYE
jgi:hypothetical protein